MHGVIAKREISLKKGPQLTSKMGPPGPSRMNATGKMGLGYLKLRGLHFKVAHC